MEYSKTDKWLIFVSAASGYQARDYEYLKNGGKKLTLDLNPRAGWDDAFSALAKDNDDVLLDGESSPKHSCDDEKWQEIICILRANA